MIDVMNPLAFAATNINPRNINPRSGRTLGVRPPQLRAPLLPSRIST
jgi:hypothetical protein